MSVQNVELEGGALLTPPAVAAANGAASGRREYLFGPVIDFLCLGGASLIALALLALLTPVTTWQPQVAFAALLVAHFVNHPHFAHSYQIFYRDFRTKAFGDSYPAWLRRRYVFAGIVVPLLLIAMFAIGILSGDARRLGMAANVMAFFVGWHYVKQGYGMLMVDAALKRRFFDGNEKKILLLNAYVCWIASWLGVNWAFNDSQMWGLAYYMIPVPDLIFHAGLFAAFVSSALMLYMLARKTLAGARPPLNGTVAYLTSLYAWLMFAKINPLYLLVIPAFHSLQYMLVVWRFQINRERDLSRDAPHPRRQMVRRLAGFAAGALVLGFAGFWFAPSLLDQIADYDRQVFGASLFLFVFWIFINVHHYFLDSVMWRRENPETKKYLFG